MGAETKREKRPLKSRAFRVQWMVVFRVGQVEVRARQNRPLETVYPILWLNGLTVKIHQGKQVVNKLAHVILGVNLRDDKEVLGL